MIKNIKSQTNSFWISIFGFECSGLLRIWSLGIRILIRGRLGAINFVEVVLLNISKGRIYNVVVPVNGPTAY